MQVFRYVLMCFVCIGGVALITGCGSPETSPEDRIRAFVVAGEEAAEQRSLDYFKQALAEGYSDNHGLTKKEMLRMLAGYFFRNQSIHVVSKVGEITFLTDEHAEVVVFVAMAGSPEVGFDQLQQLRADLYRVELSLVLGDDIQVTQASWRRSTPAEAFN
jgi:hypothetical protein